MLLVDETCLFMANWLISMYISKSFDVNVHRNWDRCLKSPGNIWTCHFKVFPTRWSHVPLWTQSESRWTPTTPSAGSISQFPWLTDISTLYQPWRFGIHVWCVYNQFWALQVCLGFYWFQKNRFSVRLHNGGNQRIDFVVLWQLRKIWISYSVCGPCNMWRFNMFLWQHSLVHRTVVLDDCGTVHSANCQETNTGQVCISDYVTGQSSHGFINSLTDMLLPTISKGNLWQTTKNVCIHTLPIRIAIIVYFGTGRLKIRRCKCALFIFRFVPWMILGWSQSKVLFLNSPSPIESSWSVSHVCEDISTVFTQAPTSVLRLPCTISALWFTHAPTSVLALALSRAVSL